MVDRPFSDIRPLGPLFEQSDKQSSPPSDKLKKFKSDIEESIGIELSNKDAAAIYLLDTPMLQSYVSNVLAEAEKHSDEVNVQSVIESKATKKYARKVGSVDELEEAISVYS